MGVRIEFGVWVPIYVSRLPYPRSTLVARAHLTAPFSPPLTNPSQFGDNTYAIPAVAMRNPARQSAAPKRVNFREYLPPYTSASRKFNPSALRVFAHVVKVID